MCRILSSVFHNKFTNTEKTCYKIINALNLPPGHKEYILNKSLKRAIHIELTGKYFWELFSNTINNGFIQQYPTIISDIESLVSNHIGESSSNTQAINL